MLRRRTSIGTVILAAIISISVISCSTIPVQHEGKKNVYVNDDVQMYTRYIHIIKIYKESKTFDFEYDFYARPSSESISRIVGKYEIQNDEMICYPEYLYAYVYNPGKGATKYKYEYKTREEIPEDNRILIFKIEEFDDNVINMRWVNEKKTGISIFDKAMRGINMTRILKREN